MSHGLRIMGDKEPLEGRQQSEALEPPRKSPPAQGRPETGGDGKPTETVNVIEETSGQIAALAIEQDTKIRELKGAVDHLLDTNIMSLADVYQFDDGVWQYKMGFTTAMLFREGRPFVGAQKEMHFCWIDHKQVGPVAKLFQELRPSTGPREGDTPPIRIWHGNKYGEMALTIEPVVKNKPYGWNRK